MDERDSLRNGLNDEYDRPKISELDRKVLDGSILGVIGSSIVGIGAFSSGYLAPILAGQAFTEDPRGKMEKHIFTI